MSTAAIEIKADATRIVVGNAVALLGAYALPRALTLGAIVVAARLLGAEQFGTYATAAGLAVVLSVVATLGMTPLLTRDIARTPERAARLLTAAHGIKTCSNVAMLVSLFVIVRLLDYPAPVRQAALLLCAGYALAAYAENFSAYFQAVERMHVWTQASALFGLVTGSLGIVFALTTRSIVWFALATAIGQMAALLYLRAQLPGAIASSGPPATRQLLREMAPFAFAFLTLTVYCKLDILLITEWAPAVQVGVYSAAYKFVDLMQALIVVAAAAMYPRLSRRIDLRDGQRWAGTRLIELVLLSVTAGAGLLWLMREPIVLMLFGTEFSAAVPVLGFLAAALPALGVNIAAGYVLGVRGQMQKMAWAYGGALLLNAALNAWLIPVAGATGAAMARLISECTLVGLLGFSLHRYAAAAPGGRTVLAVLAMVTGCALLTLLPFALRVPGFLLIVAAVFMQLRPFTADELDSLLRMFRRRNGTLVRS